MFSNKDYVYEIYKQGSISKAAEKLYISQPSLSASLRRVEEKIGYPIFDRGTRPFRPTEIGMKYIEAIGEIREIEKGFEDYLNDVGELRSGTIRLGGTNLIASLIAPRLISKFKKTYANIEIKLEERMTTELADMLGNGDLDMVIDYDFPYYENFDSLLLSDDYLILAVPKSFPENKGLEKYRLKIGDIKSNSGIPKTVPEVPLSAFKEAPFVLLSKVNDTYRRAINLCHAAGFEPKCVFEAAQQMTAYHVCCSGHGAAFVSSLLLCGVANNTEIYYYKLSGGNAIRRLSVLWKRERYSTKAMQEFSKMAVGEFAKK